MATATGVQPVQIEGGRPVHWYNQAATEPMDETMYTRPSGAGRAFTLLELLAAVAILVLLLAILLPALAAATAAGRSAVCGIHLNQIAQGSIAYSQANDARLPWLGAVWRATRPVDQEWWPTQVARGMEQFEPDVYRCAGDPTPYGVPVYFHQGRAYMNDQMQYSWDRGSSLDQTPNDRAKRSDHADGRTFWLQVTYRGSCDLLEKVGEAYHSRRITSWAQPHKAIELLEGTAQTSDMECYRFAFLWGLARPSGPAKRPARNVYRDFESWNRHFGTSNVLFIDGHVALYSPGALGELALAQEYQDH